MVTVMNKVDKADPEVVSGLCEQYNAIPVCALKRDTFPELLETMEAHLWSETVTPAE